MINIAALVKSAINISTPYQKVILKISNGQQNLFGVMTVSYDLIETEANVQSTSKRELFNIEGLSLSNTYLTFYFVKADLTTVNRVIEKSTDFIIFKNIEYKIVKVQDSFETDWISVICMEYKEEEVI